MSEDKAQDSWGEWLTPLKVMLLVTNAICFGACLVLLALRGPDGPLVLLTIGVGLALFAGLTGALIAARRMHPRKNSGEE